jgi:hypothetical protein
MVSCFHCFDRSDRKAKAVIENDPRLILLTPCLVFSLLLLFFNSGLLPVVNILTCRLEIC